MEQPVTLRIFFRKCLWLLPIPLVVVGTNAWMDPAHMLGPYEEERQVAQLLLQGQDVSMAANFDERMVQRYYIEGLTEREQVVVLGSSRSMQVGSEIFGPSFFNNSLPGASIEDFLGLYHIYHRRNLLPAQIVLCVDPWLLNAHNGQTRWKSLRGDVDGFLRRLPAPRRLGPGSFPLDKYYELVTPGYFQASLELLAAPQKKPPDGYTKRRDGVWIYPLEKKRATASEVRAQTEEYLSHNIVYSLEEFRKMAPALQSQFEQFVDLALRDQVKMAFFLSPYHPMVYDHLIHSERYQIVADVERYFRSIAQRKGVRVVGSYDPARAGLGEEDFYDGLHPKPGALQKLFEACAGDEAVP